MSEAMRWSPGRRQSWVHDGPVIDPADYWVQEIPDDATAKEYVVARHYSGSYPAAARRYGLRRTADNTLAGVAVLSVPPQAKVLTSVFPELEPYRESLELGRFVLDDEVAYNGESMFLAEALRLAGAEGVRGVVSFSDPVPRTDAAGQVVMPGHIGGIYQATNAAYLGRGTARTLAVLPGGTVFSARAMQKIRDGGKGHEYAEAQLVAAGAVPLRPGQDRAGWLNDALGDVGARRVRHAGNHRYAFTAGTRPQRRAVQVRGDVLPYPKERDQVSLAA